MNKFSELQDTIATWYLGLNWIQKTFCQVCAAGFFFCLGMWVGDHNFGVK